MELGLVPLVNRAMSRVCLFFFLFFIEIQLIYNAVPISAVQQSDSVVYIYIFFLKILFSIMVYPRRSAIVLHAIQ